MRENVQLMLYHLRMIQIVKGVWYRGPSKQVWFGEDMDHGFPVRKKKMLYA
jgi:hypothetical protein